MSGNVWEWCFDWHGSIKSGEVTDPTGAASGDKRVRRGGWNVGAGFCVVSGRYDLDPFLWDGNLGFRLACRP